MKSVALSSDEQLTLLLSETETIQEEIELYSSFLGKERAGLAWAAAVAKGLQSGELQSGELQSGEECLNKRALFTFTDKNFGRARGAGCSKSRRGNTLSGISEERCAADGASQRAENLTEKVSEANKSLSERGLVREILGLLDGVLVPVEGSFPQAGRTGGAHCDIAPQYSRESPIFFAIDYGEKSLPVPLHLLEQWRPDLLYGASSSPSVKFSAGCGAPDAANRFAESPFETIAFDKIGESFEERAIGLHSYFVAKGSVEVCKKGYSGSLGLFQEKEAFIVPASLGSWMLVARGPTTLLFSSHTGRKR